jgi:hypothetical protein
VNCNQQGKVISDIKFFLFVLVVSSVGSTNPDSAAGSVSPDAARDFANLLKKIDTMIDRQKTKEKKVYSKMFG